MRAFALSGLALLVCLCCHGSELENRIVSRAIGREASLTVAELCSVAQGSITVYLDNLNPAPLDAIYHSLLSARERHIDVSVILYISARPSSADGFAASVVDLAGRGCTVRGVISLYRLPRAVVVVDGRFVVEDSAPAGLPAFEGALVVDSRQMAELLEERVRMFPRFALEYASEQDEKKVVAVEETVPKTIDADNAMMDGDHQTSGSFIDFFEFRERFDARVKNEQGLRLPQ